MNGHSAIANQSGAARNGQRSRDFGVRLAIVAAAPAVAYGAGRLFRIAASHRIDSTLGALIGGFPMLHAMLHLTLAVLMPRVVSYDSPT